jgi:GAF domain-containing protein
MVAEKTVAHIWDVTAEEVYTAQHDPVAVSAVALGGIRTLLGVPLLNKDEMIGAFFLSRQEVRPFTEKQIALVKNFAAQAVIAIENARLLNELRQRTADLGEALEQQTATSEVLQVISGSPGDLQPVFAAMLENAARICDANFGNIFRWDGDALWLVATHNTPPAFIEHRRRVPFRPNQANPIGGMLKANAAIHVADLARDERYIQKRDREVVAAVELGGIRTFVAVPMLKDEKLIGAVILYRQEVRPFSDKQIELVQNFAAQAVIAIENARLLNELRQRTDDLSQRTTALTEALEQQTATSDVLQVISRSPDDLEPVFASMLEKAVRICDATFGNIYRWDGEFLNLVAAHNTPPAFAEARLSRRRPDPKMPAGRMLSTKTAIHVVDLAADQSYIEQRIPEVIAAVELGGVRTFLAVPMLKDNELIGALSLSRREVRPFTEKQIELVAIENARLLNELRQRTDDLSEALEQQTATSEVLQVISSSSGDLKPVFHAILANAVRICEANFGTLLLYDGSEFRLVAAHNPPPAFAELRRRQPEVRSSGVLARLVATKQLQHVPDCTEDASYKQGDLDFVQFVELCGARTFLGAPMLKENELIGVIGIHRQEVRAFTDKQIELISNFAAQAVIAIENARLLNELREALQQQTATADVLKVISSSPGSLEPVFKVLLENATRLCGASYGNMWLREGDAFRSVALHGVFPATYIERWGTGALLRPEPDLALAQTAKTRQPFQIADVRASQSYRDGNPIALSAVNEAGMLAVLTVPMLKDNDLVGAIAIQSKEARP